MGINVFSYNIWTMLLYILMSIWLSRITLYSFSPVKFCWTNSFVSSRRKQLGDNSWQQALVLSEFSGATLALSQHKWVENEADGFFSGESIILKSYAEM